MIAYTHVYSFTGKIIPDWIKLSSGTIEANIKGVGECPNGYIKISFENSAMTGQFFAEQPFVNLGTLWTVIESQIQAVIDAIGFTGAAKMDVYVNSIRDDTCQKQLEFDSIGHNLVDILNRLGVGYENVAKLMCDSKYEYHLRHALFHARQSLNVPSDTVLNGYRAIETLRNYFVDSIEMQRDKEGKPPKDAWKKFREHYGIDEEKVRSLADLSRPLRHGNYRAAIVLDGATRNSILEDIWYIVGLFIKVESALAT